MPASKSPCRLAAALLALGLAACGGGSAPGADALAIALPADTAQGYAADAATMPAAAALGLGAATALLEVGLAGTSTAGGSVPCLGGGRVAWSATGASPALLSNGRLDAGEMFAVTFMACSGGPGEAVLDGSLTLTVNAYSDSAADLSLVARALTQTTPFARTSFDGSVRLQRSTVLLAGGGRQQASLFTASALSLSSTRSGRQASYSLLALSWSESASYDANGTLTARTQSGLLDMVAASPRRPTATLHISAQSTLALGSDGLVSTGTFSLTADRDRLAVNVSPTTVTVQLDVGNDGRIDFSWTLPRSTFFDAAG
jgi:hypothetical protein